MFSISKGLSKINMSKYFNEKLQEFQIPAKGKEICITKKYNQFYIIS